MERIHLDRRWIGPPAGTFGGNPTVLLGLAAATLLTVGTVGHLRAILPATVVLPLHAIAIYLAFTVLHESMHGVAHSSRWVNDLLGRLAAVPLTISIAVFRGVHHEHHSHTNDPARDPDLIVARRPRLGLPLWCLGIVFEYRRAFFGRRLWRSRAQLGEALMMEAVLLVVAVAAVAGGWWRELMILWFGPAAVALLFLAFAFDFLPHYPHDTLARYLDTRVYPGRALNVLLLGQNYHLIHHLWTTIPWYRYRRVFVEVAEDLAARGGRVGWRVAPHPDGAARAEP